MRLAVLGLGQIGGGVARLALQAGHDVAGYDVDAARLDEIDGLIGAESAQAAALGADCAVLAVYDDAQVLDLVTGPASILAVADRPTVVLVVSTVSLDTVRRVADLGREVGVEVLDCGVSGGTSLLMGQRLALAIGGRRDAVERVRPLLDSFGHVHHLGGLGAGMAAKLCRNVIVYVSGWAAYQAAQLAEAADIDGGAFIDFVRRSDQLTARPGDYLTLGTDGDVALAPRIPPFAAKDLAAALDLAATVGARLPVAELALAGYRTVVEQSS
jgi:3-hydroxyisobutyrate dehydrogenase